jgi:hypothetical protein
MVQNYAARNFFIDVEDKIPIFICSVGAHLFNTINKCRDCDFDPEKADHTGFAIHNCPMRHDKHPIYTPMSRLADTRIHILMRGDKGSGKSILIQLFLGEHNGLLYNKEAMNGVGFRTMLGPNSITEAGMFGSVDEEGNITGRPLAREMCGGFLGFEEFSSMSDAQKKDHSVDMKNQMLTSTDNGRVMKAMKSGWVQYNTRYTLWAGTQPARFELESGLDRRFFIIDIEMSPGKELEYKRAQRKQAQMTNVDRAELAGLNIEISRWFLNRQLEVILSPPTGIMFGDKVEEWLERPEVRSFESDLFRRLCIGYTMMREDYIGDVVLDVVMTPELAMLLESSLNQRRNVMDADLMLIKDTFWQQDLSKSQLLKEVERMITNDYQAAKRWMEESLMGQSWYYEYVPSKEGRGRKGVVCRIGAAPTPEVMKTIGRKIIWGGKEMTV